MARQGNSPRPKTRRVQLDLSPLMDAELSRLVTASGLATRAEVLRRAIRIYGALVDEAKSGNHIEIRGRGSRRWKLVSL